MSTVERGTRQKRARVTKLGDEEPEEEIEKETTDTTKWERISDPTFRMRTISEAEGAWIDVPTGVSPGRIFDLMISRDDVESICAASNAHHKQKEGGPQLHDITPSDLYQYWAQELFMGIVKLPEIADYFRQKDAILADGVFPAGLNKQRWIEIHAHLSPDLEDFANRLRKNFILHRIPSGLLVIDEAQLALAGVSHKSLDICGLCDSTGYLYNFRPQLTKPKMDKHDAVLEFVGSLPPTMDRRKYHLLLNHEFGSSRLAEELQARHDIMFTMSCGAKDKLFTQLAEDLQHGQSAAMMKEHLVAATIFSGKAKTNFVTNAFMPHPSHEAEEQHKPESLKGFFDGHKLTLSRFNHTLSMYLDTHRRTKRKEAYMSCLVKMATVNAFVIYTHYCDFRGHYRDFLEALIADLVARKE